MGKASPSGKLWMVACKAFNKSGQRRQCRKLMLYAVKFSLYRRPLVLSLPPYLPSSWDVPALISMTLSPH